MQQGHRGGKRPSSARKSVASAMDSQGRAGDTTENEKATSLIGKTSFPAVMQNVPTMSSPPQHHLSPRSIRGPSDSHVMADMRNALPQVYSRHQNHRSQAYTSQTPVHMSAPMVIPDNAAPIYQIPPGYTLTPTAALGPSAPYSTFVRPPFVPGYPAPGPPPASYTIIAHDIVRPDMVAQVSSYSQITRPYYLYQDPLLSHIPSPLPPYGGQSIPSNNDHLGIGRRARVHKGPGASELASHASITRDIWAGSIAAGPPRKPKQSGFAIWVGNLPSSVTILSLKEYFSAGFTSDIESLFLISRSNCAFVNYRTEDACNRAMKCFHDSKFEGTRLVCRLRKIPVPVSNSSSNTPVPVYKDSAHPEAQPQGSMMAVDRERIGPADEMVDGFAEATPDDPDRSKIAAPTVERYFIIKSLTLQDLEQSVHDGMWATQVHNEEALNQAFKTCDMVHLIFSVNKSGEYFGHAQMRSAIETHAVDGVGGRKRAEIIDTVGQHRTMSTDATRNAPRGHVTDDMFRGTLFWEADVTNATGLDEVGQYIGKEATEEPTWGKPFQVKWLSTTRVPFWRTKGMKNPWNANREIKIARDGTEIEPGVGARLLDFFVDD